jgi:hypothetical protein
MNIVYYYLFNNYHYLLNYYFLNLSIFAYKKKKYVLLLFVSLTIDISFIFIIGSKKK